MPVLMRPWGHMHFRVRGPEDGVPVVFLNSLGTDLRMWDAVLDRLPGLRAVGLDKPGHGLSATPSGDWSLADLAADAVALMDHLGIARAVVAGCSIGGMIGQMLGARHPDRVRGLVLSNTAMKVGTAESWAARIEGVRSLGMAGLAPQVIERWFAAPFRATDEVLPWVTMLARGDAAGYVGTCRVLAAANLTAESPRIACPVLLIGGSADLSTPVDLVRATAAAIPGARVEVIEGSGHIPAIDNPDRTAALIGGFVEELA
jgi:3-oxoadipate enol-lactonase